MATVASLRMLQALPTELRLTLTTNAAFARCKRFVSTAAEQDQLIAQEEQRQAENDSSARAQSAFVPPRLHTFTATTKFRDMLLKSPNPIETLTQELERVADQGRVIAALQVCKEIQKRLVFGPQASRQPDIRVYKALMKAFASQGFVAECERTVDDMLEVGVGPDTGVYNLWLQVRILLYAYNAC